MDDFNNEAENIPETSGEESTTPQWWIDEQTAGIGERPDWLPEKFKSAKDVSKSYQELEKRLGSAPKEYDFSKASDWLDADNESIKEFADFAKEKNVPQEVIDKMQESMTKYISGFDTDFETERAKLGEDAVQRIETLNNWMQSNLSEQTYETLMGDLDTAEQVMALEELRGKMLEGATMVPHNDNEASNNAQTVSELQDELTQNLDKYKTDEKYRKDYSRRMEQAAKNGPFKDKVY